MGTVFRKLKDQYRGKKLSDGKTIGGGGGGGGGGAGRLTDCRITMEMK